VKIGIACAAPINYNPAFYLEKSFRELGHAVWVVDQQALDQQALYHLSPDDVDLLVGVDSGGPLNIPDDFLNKACMWYIDSRRNCKPEIRTPNDDETAQRLLTAGGIVFQAQSRDKTRLDTIVPQWSDQIVYLPLASDPEVWSDRPSVRREHPCAFVGNCYDNERLGVLSTLATQELLYWPGIEGAIMQDGAAVYRTSVCGLNMPSFWGTPECYDVNMRVFEILSCGIPLITNDLPDLIDLGIDDSCCFTYLTPPEIPSRIRWLNKNREMALLMGAAGRRLIVQRHTYTHRAQTILNICKGLYIRD